MANFHCPLCESYSKNKGKLYGHDVCELCARRFVGNRCGAVWIDMTLVLMVIAMVLAVIGPSISGSPTFLQTSSLLVRFGSILFMLYFYEIWIILLALFVWAVSSSYGLMSPWLLTLIVSRSLVLPCMMLFRDGITTCSPGRWLVGMRVVDAKTGEPVSMIQSMKRNAIFFIPSIFLLFICGNRLDRHWGDRWAGTKVIIHKKRFMSIFTQELVCEKCSYNLKDMTGVQCPECGQPISHVNMQRLKTTESADELSC